MEKKLGVVHRPGPWGGPWTRSMGWSMDPVRVLDTSLEAIN